jgi:hypothetical protein
MIDGDMRSVVYSKGITAKLLGVFALVASITISVPLPANAAGDTVTLIGGGWGHAVGMSQFGAQGQALEDPSKTAADIVTHYYTGTTVKQLTDTLAADNFLLQYDDPLWVGLLQDRTSFRFIPRGGDLELCLAGNGEECPDPLSPQDGESWAFVKSGSSCRFERDAQAQGSPGDCSATITWAAGTRVELPDWSAAGLSRPGAFRSGRTAALFTSASPSKSTSTPPGSPRCRPPGNQRPWRPKLWRPGRSALPRLCSVRRRRARAGTVIRG